MENNTSKGRGFFAFIKSRIALALGHFSKNEWRIFLSLLVIALGSVIWILANINKTLLVEVPMHGGSISEGMIGTPRFINPILAFSDTDRDMVSLIYSGLMRKGTDGNYVPDLAESYSISEDGLSYTFVLKENLEFHDGEALSVDDIIFTINQATDPIIKSPQRGLWEGVSMEKLDERTIKFVLDKPYASFMLNTTLGILPEHIWRDSPIELHSANMNPIGTGPYKVLNLKKNSDGVAVSYTLESFKHFALGKPYIKQITLRFYENEESLIKGLESGQVAQASAISPDNALLLKDKGYRIETSTLPRIFGLFFNQNQNQIFTNKNVLRAINLGIDKDRIVREVLLGYGTVAEGPMPQNLVRYQQLQESTNTSHEENLQKAMDILNNDGWKTAEDGYLEKTVKDGKKSSTSRIEFSIATGNAPELAEAGNIIVEDLAKIGIKAELQTFEVGNLNQLVIRPRKYDVLLFGQSISAETDLYAFWHSSQRKDPGLNVAMYTNPTVDKILEGLFTETDPNARAKKYAQFETEIKKDMPAVFLYSPTLIYVIEKNIKGLSIDHTGSPRERFLNIPSWYTNEDSVWSIFSK